MRAERVSFAAVRKVTEVQPKKERKQECAGRGNRTENSVQDGQSPSVPCLRSRFNGFSLKSRLELARAGFPFVSR